MFQRRKARILLVVLVVVSFVLVTVDFRTGGDGDGPLDRVRSGIATVVRPLQEGVSSVVRPLGDAVGGVTDIFSVRAENDRLQARIDTLEERYLSAQDIERENAELRELLDYRDRAEIETVTGGVIALSANQFEYTVTLDVGTADGVQRDMPVINGDGLVGRVVIAFPRSSVVLLAIDPTFNVTARTSATGEIGTVGGRGGEPLAFEPIDPAIELEAGQELVTSSYDNGLYPTGIPIGTISEVGDAAAGALAREAGIQPFVDFTRLHNVLVVVNVPTDPIPPFEDSDDLDITTPDGDPFVDPDAVAGDDGGGDEADDGDAGGEDEADVEGEGSADDEGGT